MKKEHRKLFNKYCKHRESYNICPGIGEWYWKDCSDCKLITMPYMIPHSGSIGGEIQRDVCFVIWHGREGQLKQRNLYG